MGETDGPVDKVDKTPTQHSFLIKYMKTFDNGITGLSTFTNI